VSDFSRTPATQDDVQKTGVQPVAGSAIRRALETSPFPILLVCLVGVVLLSVFAPAIVVGDTWLTLMAGREVVENGLPHTEHLTVLGEGRTWTDQQWLAQVVFYAAHGLAGMRAVILLGIAFVLLALGFAFATARTGGASSRSTFVIGCLAILAGPWGWTLRAQTAALPLFAGVLWLLVDAGRRGVRNRTLLVLPLLVLWANLHGSVVLGAGLAVLLGLVELVRARRLEWIPLALVVVSLVCGVAVLVLLRRGAQRGARVLAAGAVVSVIWGWAVAQHPNILPPSLTVSDAAASSATLKTVLIVFGIAVVLVLPSLGLLFTLVQRNLVEETTQPARPEGSAG